jgi:hypothetical protein
MTNIDRQRENLQDLSTIERLRKAKTPMSVCVASEIECSMALRDWQEQHETDSTESRRALVNARVRAAKELHEISKRLIAIPRKRMVALRLVVS